MKDQALERAEAEYNEKMRHLREASTEMRQGIDLLISLAQANKPDDRSEADRLYAIWITDLQKVRAFYLTYLHVA